MGYFYVIGTDKRTFNIKEMLKEEGKVTSELKEAKYILAPIPLSKDGGVITGTNITCNDFISMCKDKIVFTGGISDSLKRTLENNNIKYYDLMKYNEVAILNAIPTSEGAIMVAMECSDITLSGSNVLVLGYGRIGKILSRMLHGIGAKVYCEARKKEDLAQIKAMGYNNIDLNDLDEFLPSFDYIFNTIPDMILNKKRLDLVKQNVCIIDVASYPGGVDFEYAKERGINARLELALPTRVAPLSSSIYIKQKIDEIIQDSL